MTDASRTLAVGLILVVFGRLVMRPDPPRRRVGWNAVEFVGLSENFRNRGHPSEKQVEVMQALWARPHVTFKSKCHKIEDAGIGHHGSIVLGRSSWALAKW